MNIGVGIDRTVGLSFDEEAQISVEAASLGYTSIWTPEGTGYDAFQVCLNRWQATRQAGFATTETGISVSPVALRTPLSLAMSAGTLSYMSDGKFILGIGSGDIYRTSGRRAFGFNDISVFDVMTVYLRIVRSLLAGEEVTCDYPTTKLHKISLDITPIPFTPVYLAALGPKMLGLAGELADGVALNWCTSDQVKWSREVINKRAKMLGRDLSNIKIVEYVRVCVDDDVDLARRALAKAMLGYAMGPAGGNKKLGYRAHFDRMGFSDALTKLDHMRDNGKSMDEMADAFPTELLSKVGYYGNGEGVVTVLQRLMQGLDTLIVRVVPARLGFKSALTTMEACSPVIGSS